MRYKGSVEDRVHSLLSERLENIHGMFGQIPDVLQDVWIDVALNDIEEAQRKIDAVPKTHPFGLLGLFRIMALVLGLIAFSISSLVTLKQFSSFVSIKTGIPSAIFTISG